jgi:DNA gyrase subunit A
MNVSEKTNAVIAMEVVQPKSQLLVVTENGYGKRTSIEDYPIKGRGTKGVLTAKLTAKKGGLAGALVVDENQELLFISQKGMVQRTSAGEISQTGRATQGVKVMNLKSGDKVSATALVAEPDEQELERAAAGSDAPSKDSTVKKAPAKKSAASKTTAKKSTPAKSRAKKAPPKKK